VGLSELDEINFVACYRRNRLANQRNSQLSKQPIKI